jgi:hypothetical protein
MADLLPPPKPIPIKDRLSILYIEYGHLDVLDGAFVVVDKTGVCTGNRLQTTGGQEAPLWFELPPAAAFKHWGYW